jgi:hypothetical protein
MTQQTESMTAVEWLIEQLIPKAMATYDSTTYNAIQQAKEMEKGQIIDAWLSGEKGISIGEKKFVGLAEQYYNETYNK